MELMNNEVNFDLVMSDMYVGLWILARVQREQRALAIEKLNEVKTQLYDGDDVGKAKRSHAS